MVGKLLDFVHGNCESPTLMVQRGSATPDKRLAACLLDATDQRHALLLETFRDCPRQDRAMHEARADYPDADLLDTQHGRVEDVARRKDTRKPDDAGRIAGQQEDVGSWGSVELGKVDAQAEPQRQDESQDDWLIHKV